MSDAPPPDFVAMLTYVLDESREARDLLRISQAGLARRSQGWREKFGPTVRTGKGIASGLSAQYLGENMFRARAHWRAGMGYLRDVVAVASTNENVRLVEDELRRAGVDGVMPKLADEAIPYDRKKAATHLQAVLDQMSDCDDVIVKARSKLLLQRMRNE
jgi:hypothetical protein